MNNNKRLIASVAEIAVGAAMVVGVRLAGGDSVWIGMGGGLLFVGIVNLILGLRFASDREYREKVSIEASDERNVFLRGRAWSWAGVAFVITGGVLTILFRILGKPELSSLCGCGVCLLVTLYWISFVILKKKY